MNKKEYLRYGMMVVFRNGERAMYMPSVNGNVFDFCNNRECILLEEFNKDLTHKWNHFYDIAEIYGLAEYPYQTTILNIRNRATIWQRKEYPVLTKYEYEVLKKATGLGYRFFTRNAIGFVRAYEFPVEKDDMGWKTPGLACTPGGVGILAGEKDFSFIDWKDEKPWDARELLDNCEVEK